MSRSAVSIVQDLLKIPENSICADCQKKAAKWASTNLGIFICIDCSGIHRSLGTHISFVRSCTLDEWSLEQAHFMESVGNAVANAYWEAELPADFVRPDPVAKYDMINFIKQKYVSRKWAAAGPPPGQSEKKEPAPVPARPTRSHSHSHGRRDMSHAMSKSTEVMTTDDITLDDIFGESEHRRHAPVRQHDQVSSTERKPGKKIPARLARKMKANEPPVRHQRPPPSVQSEPNLSKLHQEDEEDPFA